MGCGFVPAVVVIGADSFGWARVILPLMAAKTRDLRTALRVRPGSRVDLSKIDPGATHGHTKANADEELAAGLERLTDLQDRIWAEARHKVLVVLQGIDAAGKDGTVRHVMSAFNPQGCPVTSFKVP